MKKFLLLILLSISAVSLFAQKVDSIFFHLYTDSLKKGQYNYINIDGKLSDGRWMPRLERSAIRGDRATEGRIPAVDRP